MSTAEHQYCYRHPDQETGLACSECGRPICADCATFAAVGIRCPDHAGAQGGKKPMQIKPPRVHRARGISLGTSSAPVTKLLIAANAAIYLITVSQGSGINSPGGSLLYRWILFGPAVAHGGWYRLVTSMFLHASLLHIGFNMYILWWAGTQVEQYLGSARFIGLYFVSGIAGSAGALLYAPLAPTLGASGAVFGVLGAMAVLEWQTTGRLGGQAMTLIGINLVLGFVITGVAWSAHIGGLVGGVLIMLSYAHWGGKRSQYGKLGLGGIFGLVAVAGASIAIAYFRVRGYA
jgi:membrane associated rhomboid family serine protease